MSKVIYYNGEYKPLSQKLRREMTRQERHLWYDFLKSYHAAFRRQKQFGHYIVDFYVQAPNWSWSWMVPSTMSPKKSNATLFETNTYPVLD